MDSLVAFGLDDEQQKQFEVNERRKKQNRIAQQNFRKKRSKELAQQTSSTRPLRKQYDQTDTPLETQQDNVNEETPDAFSKSLSSNDLACAAYSDMPRNISSTPYSTYQPCKGVPFAQLPHHDQPHQAIPVQYTTWGERYHSEEVSLQAPYGSSISSECFLSTPAVQEGEAVCMICWVNYRAVLEMFSHCPNSCGFEAIKDANFPDSWGQEQSTTAPTDKQGPSNSYMTSTSTDNGNKWQIPLHISAEKGHDKSIRALLDSEADGDAVNSTGFTALHLAARNGHIDVVKTLLEYDANVHATDESGWTALHHAANNDREAIVRLLTRRGADNNAKARDRGSRQRGR